MSYQARRAPQTETLALRGLQVSTVSLARRRIRVPSCSCTAGAIPARRGSSSSISCRRARTLVAMDMRGFGRTQRPDDGYWFPDYLADLDALLDHLSPDAPLDLVGHSMGGNIVMLYAGARPQRVRKVVEPRSVRVAAHECRAGAGALRGVARRSEARQYVRDVRHLRAVHAGAGTSQPAHAARSARVRRPLVGAPGRGRTHRAVGRSEAQARQSRAVSARPGGSVLARDRRAAPAGVGGGIRADEAHGGRARRTSACAGCSRISRPRRCAAPAT